MISHSQHPSIATAFLQQVRSHTARIGYRRHLREQLKRTLPAYLLPTLATLPLAIELKVDLASASLATLLDGRGQVALYGSPGSGRSLALRQLAWRWAMGGDGPTPLLLDLAHHDQMRLAPSAIVIDALIAAGENVQAEGTSIQTRGRWLLLVDGWEALSEDRRSEWHAFLLTCAQTWPGSQQLISVPDDSVWPTHAEASMVAPNDAQLESMVAALLPQHDPTPILAALAPDAPLAALRASTTDLVLLAGRYPHLHLPRCRADVWQWAYEQFVAVPADPQSNDWLRSHPIMRRYRLARDLAAATPERLTQLASLSPTERATVAAFLVELLPDPNLLYAALWGTDRPAREDLLTIGRCMRARQRIQHWQTTQGPVRVADSWEGRTLVALAEQAATHDAATLLHEFEPLLRHLTQHALSGNEAAHTELVELLQHLPASIAAPQLLVVLDAAHVNPAQRWAAGDALLATQPPDAWWQTLLQETDYDALSAAARCYLLSLATPHTRLLLDERACDWLRALCDDRVAGSARQARVSTTLLADAALAPELRAGAVTLLDAESADDAHALISITYRDAPTPVRHAVLLSVEHRSPEEAIELLCRTVLDATAPDETRLEAVESLARYRVASASIGLANCALVPSLPLWGRLRALALLAQRRGAAMLLRKLLRLAPAHDSVRAAAVEALTAQVDALRDQPLPIELVETALNRSMPLARRSAARALGLLGIADTARALDVLARLVESDPGDIALLEHVITAAGLLEDEAAVPLLAPMLGASAYAHLRRAWTEQIHQCQGVAPEDWPLATMPPDRRQMIATTYARCESRADRPSAMDELLQLHAIHLSDAAAAALTRIGGEAACAELRYALLAAPDAAAPALIAALNTIDGGPSTLIVLLEDADATRAAPLRWLIVQQLAASADAYTLQRLLAITATDPFARGALARALGGRNDSCSLPLLRQLSEQPAEDPYVRAEAIAALGALTDPAVQTSLLLVVIDHKAPLSLRHAAAAALPAGISAETRLMLREMVRLDRPPAPLLAGLLEALGAARDRESLPLMLRYCQHEQPDVAQAALTAIAHVGDSSIIPVLVHIAQSPVAEPIVRIQAQGVLLRIGGEEFAPFLQPSLEASLLPLQLQALEHLLAVCPHNPLVLATLRNQATPLPVRQRIVRALTEQHTACSSPDIPNLLCALLADSSEDDTLRMLVAELFATARWDSEEKEITTSAVCATLLAATQAANTAPELRWRCINALTAFATPEAWLGLSRLAADRDQPEDTRDWATQAHIAGLCFKTT